MGFSVNYWFNHHQLPWQSSDTPTTVYNTSTSKISGIEAIAP
ncbi:MAG: hypothetical protein V7K21_25035 [Nostoc sp.]